MTATQVLRNALELVDQGWIQGRMYDKYGDRAYYCAYGALHFGARDVDLDSKYNPALQRWDFDTSFEHADQIVRDTLERRFGTRNIVSWNDHSSRRKEQVLELFRAALEEAEKR